MKRPLLIYISVAAIAVACSVFFYAVQTAFFTEDQEIVQEAYSVIEKKNENYELKGKKNFFIAEENQNNKEKKLFQDNTDKEQENLLFETKFFEEFHKKQALESAEIKNENKEEYHNTVQIEKVKSGDTFASIFSPYLSAAQIHNLITNTKETYNLSRIIAGKKYYIEQNSEKKIVKFTYELNRNEFLLVERTEDDKFVASKIPIYYDSSIEIVSNSITSSLFDAFIAIGEKAALAINLADIFSFEIDFIKDIQKNDKFTVLVEKFSKNGTFSHYGRILAAYFINNNTEYEAFYYNLPAKSLTAKYYTREGKSLQKMLLKAPLHFSRVSSGFSMNRMHPILKIRRPHPGIDYAAPMGTPVMSVGDGVVTFIGRRGGYGKHIVIRHDGGFESMYSHLSSYARGLKKGSRVKQGQRIGAVGSTGLSTGPHLDFRLKKNGNYVNPGKAITPRVAPLTDQNLRTHLKQIELLESFVNKEVPLESYNPKSIL